jgi:signal transduction histidine kinase/ligand-binding sensor domain-containing protein
VKFRAAGCCRASVWAAAVVTLLFAGQAYALDPHKTLTQYSWTTWTQEHGLPQDTIRAITQTPDGYLWLGTDEGLARFDGYEFIIFNKTNGDLPSNSVAALSAASDGTLWIGTSNGLVRYRDKRFRTLTMKDGLPDNTVTELYEDHANTLWIIAGNYLSRLQDGLFKNYAPGRDMSIASVRHIREDRNHDLWVCGFSAVLKMSGDRFVPLVNASILQGDFVTTMGSDVHGNFWLGGSSGMIRISSDGTIRRYDTRNGLPDAFVRAFWVDRDGNLWVGTNAGIARLEGDRFVTAHRDDGRERDQVRCLFEDREGDLWIGSSTGLSRLRDTVLTAYGKSEGLPSDEPNTVYQDRAGRIWIGFHDGGLMQFAEGNSRIFTEHDGLPGSEIFSIREAHNGDLLIGARRGMVRMHDGHFSVFEPPDQVAHLNVFDALEDSTGRIWLATPGGLGVLHGKDFHFVVQGPPLLVNAPVTLCEGRDGSIWAGTYGKGLWRIQGDTMKLLTTADGLSSDEIRSLYQDREGTLWIGTAGGGLNALRDGRFQRFQAQDGLLSDNVTDVLDDGESLWLSTTRGICRVPKKQFEEFAAHKRKSLEPENFGVGDGLRSAQCSPSYPTGGGGHRTHDGRAWFTTTRGLAVYSPGASKQRMMAPVVHLVELSVDGHPVNLDQPVQLGPNSERVQIRYTGVHLSAPEQVRYSYRLNGLDTRWVQAGSRRLINYNSLHHGSYEFAVRAEIPGGPAAERSYSFEVLPSFYETAWFRVICALLLCATAWAVYQFRLRQIRYRFALVLEERARLAREIHDTLAQGFVGISSQLDAVAMCMPEDVTPARRYLDLARRMARHSLTEARRSVMDLRASALEGQDLASALESGMRLWVGGSGVEVSVDVSGEQEPLPQEVEQHLLRIAQEAVTNVLKHAGAKRIWIKLHMEARKLYLRIKDDGRGFEQDGVFAALGGHFGLIGMRERAERLGGEMRLVSQPGEGTEVEVKVPLP